MGWAKRVYVPKSASREGDFPITEAVARSTLALLFSGVMTEEQVEYVCEALKGARRQ